jgi:glycosyltransferase involved in cell wall biosynthesis
MFKDIVSVIIPHYNSAGTVLHDTILSVLRQSYTNIEIIVVDDGSTTPFNNVNSILKDERIHWYQLEANYGVAIARNRGVDAAKGQLISFLDTGDSWEPDKLKEQINLFNKLDKKEPAVIYVGAELIRSTKKRIMLPTLSGDIFKQLLIQNYITGSSSSVLMPKSIFVECGGFDNRNDIPEDWDLWVRLAKTFKFYYVNSKLVTIHLVPGSRSDNPAKKAKTYLKFMLKHCDDVLDCDALEPFLAEYFSRISILYRNAGDFKSSLKYQLSSTKLCPTPKSVIKCLLTIIENLIGFDIVNKLRIVG